MKKVNVLWTGGWDSTFRIMQLSTKKVTIQPYYLKDNRQSEKIELDTIREITEIVRNRASTNCVLEDVISIRVSEVQADDQITEAYRKLFLQFKNENRLNLGSQYEWLARFAKSIGTLDLSIEKGTKPIVAIEHYGALKKVDDRVIGEYYMVDESRSPEHLNKVFGYYHYPLVEFSKLAMKKEAEDNGFIDVMNRTWFCHKPVNNQPCGVCNPCASTIDEGFQYRFTEAALRRYRTKKIIKPIENTVLYKGIRKLFRIIRS